MSSNNNIPFIQCFHPIKVRKPNGEHIMVPCGKCHSCLINRSNRNTFLCSLEEKDHRYCYFVTLTYDMEHLPLSKLHFYDYDILDPSLPSKWVKLVKLPRIYKEKYERSLQLDTRRTDNELTYFSNLKRTTGYEKYGIKYRDYDVSVSPYDPNYNYDSFVKKCNLNGLVPYLSRYDLQLFLKRFRFNLKKYSNENIRYYAVGEYGPTTFRPHYHLLIYFSEEETLKGFEKTLHSSWTFGRVDFSLSRGNCSSYVAKYVNCYNPIPRLFKTRSIMPFAVHSVKFAENVLKSQKAQIYSDEFTRFIHLSGELNGKVIDFMPWRSLTLRYFPKCRGFSDCDTHQLYNTYTIFNKAKDYYGEEKIIKLAEYISRDVVRHEWTIGFIENYYVQYIYDKTPNDVLFSQIYHDLIVSKYFISFVCDNNRQLIHKRISQIKDFYKFYDYFLLTQQYDSQSYFYQDYRNQQVETYFWYNNYEDYYHELPTKLEDTRIFQEWSSCVTSLFENNGKHKELNDLNLIYI